MCMSKHLLRSATFVFADDEDRGKGWRLEAKPYFDPAGGLGVAHDILEEFPSEQDQPHHEFLALGAAIYGRGSCGMLGNFRSSAGETLVYDSISVIEHVLDEEGYWLTDAPPQKPLPEDFEYAERILRDFSAKAAEVYTSNWKDYNEDNRIEIATAYIPHAVNWMRVGFRRARKRYEPTWDGSDVAMMFERIANEADHLSKHAEIDDLLRVVIDRRRHDLQMIHTPYYARREYRDW